METQIAQFAALAHPQRLAVFRLLMRHHPRPVPAGEIGTALGIRAPTLSGYLSALADAGLIEQQRRATTRRYRVCIDSARNLTAFLALDCCRGRIWLPVPEPGPHATAGGVRNVLFLCGDNAALSQIAEALLRQHAGDRFEAFSAGTAPCTQPDPQAMALLARRGLDTDCLWTKSEALFRASDAPRMDVVVTLCNRAADAESAFWPGAPVLAHWPLDALPAGPGRLAAACAALETLTGALAALPPDLPRPVLQEAVDALCIDQAPS